MGSSISKVAGGLNRMTSRIEVLKQQTMEHLSEVNLDRARLVTESYQVTEGMSSVIRRAKAMVNFFLNAPLKIYDNELIVGDRSWVQPYGYNYPDCSPRHIPKSDNPDIDAELRDIWSYWQKGDHPGAISPLHGHCVPGFKKLLEVGFDAMRDEARDRLSAIDQSDPDQKCKADFWRAVEILADGCGKLGRRFAGLAGEMAENTRGKRREELMKIAQVCHRVPSRPARNFREAVQSLWFGELLIEAEDTPNAHSPGRIDQILYPYYQRDRDNGEITKEEAKELLACYWIKMWAPYDVHDTIVGGLTAEGSSAVNELSYMILEVQSECELHRQLSVRYSHRLPDEFVGKACDVVRDGLGVPQWFNDDVIVPGLVDMGVDEADANDYAIIGCVETVIPGLGDSRAVSHYSNLPKCLEYALTNGVCLISGKKRGPETGDISDVKSFDDLWERYEKQVAYDIQRAVDGIYNIERKEAENFPLPLLSLLTDDCLEKGLDISAGGAKYNSSMFCAVGIPNVADSLAAIKKLVFEEGLFKLEEILDAMKSNFREKEQLRQALRSQSPKYGNDDDYVDLIALDVGTQYSEELARHRNPRGGRFYPSFFSFVACVSFGAQVGASPDGRFASNPLANSLSAPQGNMIKGPGAVVKSAAKLNQRQAMGGNALLVDLHPTMIRKDNGSDPLAALLRTYFSLGGSHVEFTLVDEKTLRKAQKDPESYSHLTVRVAGYSAQFVTLSRDLQEHIIERMTKSKL
jgi:formate C-acetyltransferase